MSNRPEFIDRMVDAAQGSSPPPVLPPSMARKGLLVIAAAGAAIAYGFIGQSSETAALRCSGSACRDFAVHMTCNNPSFIFGRDRKRARTIWTEATSAEEAITNAKTFRSDCSFDTVVPAD